MSLREIITTDLNHRERDRYAKGLESLATEATKAAVELRAGNDSDALISLITLALSDEPIRELMKVFGDAIPAALPAFPTDASKAAPDTAKATK